MVNKEKIKDLKEKYDERIDPSEKDIEEKAITPLTPMQKAAIEQGIDPETEMHHTAGDTLRNNIRQDEEYKKVEEYGEAAANLGVSEDRDEKATAKAEKAEATSKSETTASKSNYSTDYGKSKSNK